MYLIALLLPFLIGLIFIVLLQLKIKKKRSGSPAKGTLSPRAKPESLLSLKGFTLLVPPETLDGNLTIDQLSQFIRALEEKTLQIIDQSWDKGDLILFCTLFPKKAPKFRLEFSGPCQAGTTNLIQVLQSLAAPHTKRASVSFQILFVIRP